jgi:transcriptional regulator with XRE-family HTH domain
VPAYPQEPFAEVVRSIVQRSSTSINALAHEIRVDRGHLWRVLNKKKPATRSLIEKVAAELGLDPDDFPEYRELVVIERARANPALRDELFALAHGDDRRSEQR